MLAAGVGVLLIVIVRLLLVIGVALGGAYALTTYVELPGIVDTLVWVGAGGYVLLSLLGAFTALAAFTAAGRRL